jgi:hypothetical protein
MQRIPKQFMQAVITPDNLTDEQFYMSDRWFGNTKSRINQNGHQSDLNK